jgi:hypothetical protein
MIGENGPIPLTPDQGIVEGGAYNLRDQNEASLAIARAMQLPLENLPDFAPLHPIGMGQRGLALRPRQGGSPARSQARWSLVPPGSRKLPPDPLSSKTYCLA